jgi:hypothetical protein
VRVPLIWTIAWIGTDYFATADEGDLDGGSRGFTIYNKMGDVISASGNSLEWAVARAGHYRDARSEAKGNEPKNVAFGIYDGQSMLFVVSERSSVVFVYDVEDVSYPGCVCNPFA